MAASSAVGSFGGGEGGGGFAVVEGMVSVVMGGGAGAGLDAEVSSA